ncbi:hypothetical protein SADUNF_Sadunf08G0173000 [Salix dunnii]|uniref:Uncharacterized protein n=1 Tax=Salix dunnii TaxID=1413687 RepID=A0A835JZ77_9ROSI|nr:hypothetical protein SADUNF_Sadunf08G0173000 [Salix dunnii]
MGSLRNGTKSEINREEDEQEPILKEQNERFCMFPIRYKKAEASFRTVRISHGASNLMMMLHMIGDECLEVAEKHFISHVLAFFAASDGIVLENLAARFLNDVQIPEARAFYGFQIAMENIHSGRLVEFSLMVHYKHPDSENFCFSSSEMYSLLLETYIKDSREKHRGKANFFEKRVGDYQKASVMSSLQVGGKNYVFKMDEDFYLPIHSDMLVELCKFVSEIPTCKKNSAPRGLVIELSKNQKCSECVIGNVAFSFC